MRKISSFWGHAPPARSSQNRDSRRYETDFAARRGGDDGPFDPVRHKRLTCHVRAPTGVARMAWDCRVS